MELSGIRGVGMMGVAHSSLQISGQSHEAIVFYILLSPLIPDDFPFKFIVIQP